MNLPKLKLDDTLQPTINNLCSLIDKNNGTAYIVGGTVRDFLLGESTFKDVDIEVFDIPFSTLEKLIENEGYLVDPVGKSFLILKLKNYPIDISVPRTEQNTGVGHRDFKVQECTGISVKAAASRRDFTINSIMYNVLTEEYIDCFNGIEHLREGILVPVSDHFVEDNLRPLRAMQFQARFGWNKISNKLVHYAQKMSPVNLPKERLYEEWVKLLVKGKKPSEGLRLLKAIGWLKFFPELQAMDLTEQSSKWHEEGNVFEHTCLVLDKFARIDWFEDPQDKALVGFACLCHDLGKPVCTEYDPATDKLTSIGHHKAGEGPTRTFMERLTNQTTVIDEIVSLVYNHMRPREIYQNRSIKALRRLSVELNSTIEKLLLLCKCDELGRICRESPPDLEFYQWIRSKALEMQIEQSKPQPLVMGRDLISKFGLKPGPNFKPLLDLAYDKQIEDETLTKIDLLTLIKEKLQNE